MQRLQVIYVFYQCTVHASVFDFSLSQWACQQFNQLCRVLNHVSTQDVCEILLNNCFPLSLIPGDEKGRCFTIEYVMPTNVQMTSESTVSVLSK